MGTAFGPRSVCRVTRSPGAASWCTDQGSLTHTASPARNRSRAIAGSPAFSRNASRLAGAGSSTCRRTSPPLPSTSTRQPVEIAVTPSMAATRSGTSSGSAAKWRAATRCGAVTYRSAASVRPSQASTVPRKLVIITSMPIVADSAIARAMTARAVRDSAAVMPRAAIAASGPARRRRIRDSGGTSNSNMAGIRPAAPITRRNSAAKPSVTSPPGTCSSATAASRRMPPAAASAGTSRRLRRSITERRPAVSGGAPAASIAGPSAPSSAAPRPMAAPRASSAVEGNRPVTVSTK